MIFILLVFTIIIAPQIFFCLTLKNTLKEIEFINQKITPNYIWLILIPILGIIFQFYIVVKMAESLKGEFLYRNIKLSEGKPGRSLGISYCILFSCTVIPIVGILAGGAGFICWIIYWSKINDYHNLLTRDSNNNENKISEIGKNLI